LIAIDTGLATASLDTLLTNFLQGVSGGTPDTSSIVSRTAGGVDFRCGPLTLSGTTGVFCSWFTNGVLGFGFSVAPGPTDVDGNLVLSAEAQAGIGS
jgi:hypothetical protein